MELTSPQGDGRLVRLREEPKNADLGKFKKAIRQVLTPVKRTHISKSTDGRRGITF